MDKVEAYNIIQEELEKYQKHGYEKLKQLINKPKTYEVHGKTKTYQIEIQVMWDDKTKNTLRVIGAIDDMNWYAFAPISESLLIGPEDSNGG